MGQDTVSSYTGFRTVTRKAINGVQRILLVRLYAHLMSVLKGGVNYAQFPFKTTGGGLLLLFLEKCRIATSLRERVCVQGHGC
jgi:hypothetical protein